MRGKCDASGALFVGLRYAQALAEPRLDGNDDGARIGFVKCSCQSFALKFLPARFENDLRNERNGKCRAFRAAFAML
jgi:hypothetical protein